MLKKFAFSIAAAGALSFAPAQAQDVFFDSSATSMTFNRVMILPGIHRNVVTRVYPSGDQSIQYAPTPNFFYGVASTGRPTGPGMTQYVRFNFRSEGLFTSFPCAHLAFLGRWEGVITRYNRGRGVTVGETSLPCITSPGKASIQGEYWLDKETSATGIGAYLLPDRLTDALNDYTDYQVEIHVTEGGYAYWIRDAATGTTIKNTYHPLPDDGSVDWKVNNLSAQGYAIGLVGAGTTGSFTFRTWNFTYGWF